MKLRSIVFGGLLILNHPLAAAELFKCNILDAVEAAAGRMVRNKQTNGDIALFNPLIVDTATASVHVGGTQSRFGAWTVLQRGNENGSDFVASLAGGDIIRVRVWERPIQMMFTQNSGFRILMGVCDPIQ